MTDKSRAEFVSKALELADGMVMHHDTSDLDTYREALHSHLDGFRRAALEEAAKVCEERKVGYPSYFEIDDRIQQCSDVIRALAANYKES